MSSTVDHEEQTEPEMVEVLRAFPISRIQSKEKKNFKPALETED